MIAFIFAGLILTVLIVELLSLKDPMEKVHVSYELNMKLTEPGEKITLSYMVSNTSRFPIFHLGLSFAFGSNIHIVGDKKWMERHVSREITGESMDYTMFMPPKTTRKGRFQFVIDKRGFYRLGTHYVEVGDMLGLRASVTSEEGDRPIVCTATMSNDVSDLDVLGGFLGDISVRRFIMEDPSLVVGYHDYTGYEPMKKISWLQTAKTGNLLVKQNDFTLDYNVAIAVNMERHHSAAVELEEVLKLSRTACEVLEEKRVPYAFLCNGDLGDAPEGFGRTHIGSILRSIGLSNGACHVSFGELIDRCIANRGNNRSYIIVTPELDPEGEAALNRLRSFSDHDVCVLYAGRRRNDSK